jgi:hypothetical protein
MDEATTRVTVDKQEPGYWRLTLNHPPINTIDDYSRATSLAMFTPTAARLTCLSPTTDTRRW